MPTTVKTARADIAAPPQPPYRAAAIAAGLVLVLYILTLGPSTAMWDTSEYIMSAYTMSLPHPPGNPFFVLLGRVFTLLPIAPTIAARVNILAALSSAVAAACWFLVTDRVLSSWIASRPMRLVGASVAALLGATSFTVWAQSVVNEKVYTISLAGLAISTWLAVRWLDDPDGPRADRRLVLIAYLAGLGYANHMAGVLAMPAVAVAVLTRRPRTILRWRLLLVCAAAGLLGLTPFVSQPLRSPLHPPLNTGEPTACATRLAASCTFSGLTLDRFLFNFNRGQFGKPKVTERQAPIEKQVGMYWLYFTWQWMRDPLQQHPRTQAFLAGLFLILGALGGWVHWRRDRRTFWLFGPLVLTLTVGLIFYLNFRLGWTQAMREGASLSIDTSEPRDRDYFYLWSFSAWSVWCTIGLVALWTALAEAIDGRAGDAPRARSRKAALLAAPILAVAAVPLVLNWHAASRRGDTFTADWASDVLNSVEPYGILITQGDNDTFPLWYAQEVEGVRRDVTVAVTSLLGTDWYVRQLMRRPVFPYDSARGPAVYRGRTWTRPTHPLLAMSETEADSIPQVVRLEQPQRYRVGDIDAVIPAGYLTRDQIIVLRFILDSFPDRPLHFTNGNYEQSLGLGEYVVSSGLTSRLVPHKVQADSSIMSTQMGFMDVARTRRLWDETWHGQTSMVRLGKWVDRASSGIPLQYVFTGAVLADALSRRGDSAIAKRIGDSVRAVAKAAQLESVLAPSGDR